MTASAEQHPVSRETRIAAVTALVIRDPRLLEVRSAGTVLAECALGIA